MITKKNMLTILSIAVVLVMVLSACGTKAPATPASKVPDELKIGYIMNESGENMTNMYNQFKKSADDWNAKGNSPKITVVVGNAQNSIDTQLSVIDTMITQKVNVIYDHATDTTGILPGIAKAQAAGIKWIEHRGVALDKVDYAFDLSDATIGQVAIDWWHKQLDANPDLVLNVGLIYGAQGQTAQYVRIDVLVADLQKNYPGRINILTKAYGEWDTAKSMAIMEDWLQSQKTMNALFTAAAMEANGAIQAILSSGGDLSKWWISTSDSTQDALTLIKNGQLRMTVGIDVIPQGTEAFNLSREVAMGTYSGPKKYEASTACLFIVDPSNIDKYYKP
jgi:inositol transport system substrate-binding protein